MEFKATVGSIDSLSHLSQSSSPRMGALSEDQFSVRSDDSRVKFMCSYGGKIMPRPHDCQLRYVGGETRILVVSRSIGLADLMAKLTRLCGKSVLLKFQLPDEDLDSLVSVLCEEDLENMMEEYDRLENRNASVRLRLFLFPAKSDHSVSLDLQDFDWRNAEQRFVDAVNGFSTRRQQSMPTSTGPDFLFGLDVFDRHNGVQSAAPKTNSQPLPGGSRSSNNEFAAKDLSPLLNFPPAIPPILTEDAASEKQPTSLLDFVAPVSKSSTSLVLDPASPENLEMINQLSSLIPIPSEVVQTRPDQKQPLLETKSAAGLHKSPELDHRAQEQLILLSSPSDHIDPAHRPVASSAEIEEKQSKGASPTDHVKVDSSSLQEFRPEVTSKAQIQHVPKLVSHSLPLLSTEHNYFPADLLSHVQDSKPVAIDVNRDLSSLPVQKPDASCTEFMKKQQQSSSILAEEGDLKIQKKTSERLSENRTELLASHGRAKQLDPYSNTEEQQKINSKVSSEHIQDEFKLEDSEILLRPTVVHHSKQLHHNLQPQIMSNSNTHSSVQWAGGSEDYDVMKQHMHVDGAAAELPRASAFLPPTGPNSQFPPPTIPRVASAPLPLKTYDILPKSAHRQYMVGVPQSAHLAHRQLTPAADLQQQPFRLPRIKVGQRESTGPHAAASRIQSPSRFHEKAPSGRLQAGQWVESDQGTRMLRPIQQLPSGGIVLQPIQDDHLYVNDPSGQLLIYDPSASQLLYADHQLSPPEMTAQFIPFHHDHELGHHSNDQPLDSHGHPGSAGLHHARQALAQAAGAAEGQRHAAHQVMRT